MVRAGEAIILCGPRHDDAFRSNGLMLAGIVLLGLGCAPIYPALLHETPCEFRQANSSGADGHADGERVYRHHADAAAVRAHRGRCEHRLLPLFVLLPPRECLRSRKRPTA
jgi:hypothetical protein